jgi:hypothetical protein
LHNKLNTGSFATQPMQQVRGHVGALSLLSHQQQLPLPSSSSSVWHHTWLFSFKKNGKNKLILATSA